MGKIKLDLSPELKVAIVLENVSGDLRISAWERDEIGGDGDRVTLQQRDDGSVSVHCSGDCRLNVPARASLKIHNVAGDARITGVEGEIALDHVAGDLILRDVGPVRLSNVSADLRVRRVQGDVHIGNVGADATVREVSGAAHIGHVGADLYLNNVKGSCAVDHVGSDLVLSMPFSPGNTYRFRAGSDVVCRVPPATSARFVITAPDTVKVQDTEAVVAQEGQRQIVTFGAGDAEIDIEAGGEVRLVREPEEEGVAISSISADLDFDLGFNLDLEEKLAAIEQALSEKLAGLDERLRISIERQASKAEKHAERLRRQAEKQAERLQRAAERSARRFSFSWGPTSTQPRPSTPPPEPVSDEERLLILRMVESKQITVEEAERLLAALEGRAR